MAKPTKVTKKVANPLLGGEEETSTSEETVETPKVETPKKVSTPVAPVNTDAGLLSDANATKNKLDREPKVMFLVPLAEGEKKGAVHDCFINGYQYTVKKGIMSQVPQSIANLLAEHYKIGMETGAEFLLDSDDKKLEALG